MDYIIQYTENVTVLFIMTFYLIEFNIIIILNIFLIKELI